MTTSTYTSSDYKITSKQDYNFDHYEQTKFVIACGHGIGNPWGWRTGQKLPNSELSSTCNCTVAIAHTSIVRQLLKLGAGPFSRPFLFGLMLIDR